MRRRSAVRLALCGLLGATGTALAQSFDAPAGRASATAPGGLEGIAGGRNADAAIRSGAFIVLPPERGGIFREEPAGSPRETVRPPR